MLRYDFGLAGKDSLASEMGKTYAGKFFGSLGDAARIVFFLFWDGIMNESSTWMGSIILNWIVMQSRPMSGTGYATATIRIAG